MARTSALVCLLPVALLPLLGGCMVTEPMWRAASSPVVSEPRLYGVLEPDDGDESAAAGPPALVVRYEALGGDVLYATVPLTAAGMPAEPFVYTGGERNIVAVGDALPAAQRRQLREATLALHDQQWAAQLKSNPRFRRLRPKTDGISASHDVSFEPARKKAQRCSCCADARVYALRLGRPWSAREAAAMPLPPDDPGTFPNEATILVLPYTQPRPAEDVRRAQAQAALWTPVTLLVDAVYVPFVYIACYGFGQCP